MHINKNLFVVLGLFFCLLGAQEAQDVTLKSVVVTGNTLTSESMITYTAGLRPGNTIATTEFTRAVKRLWELGLFRNIQVILNDETSEGLDITIQVEENPVLGAITYKGNKKLKKDKFDEELDLKVGQRIKTNTIHDAIKKMKSLYADDGYLLVDIEPELIETQNKTIRDPKIVANTEDVIFHIKEGKKVKIRKINFDGNKAFSDFRLRMTMKDTKEQRWYLFWRSPFDRDKYEDDMDKLRTLYRDHGYRDVALVQDTVEYAKDDRHMNILIKIDEGPQYKYRDFSLEGNTLFSDNELRDALNLKKGDLYNDEVFTSAVYERMQGLYMDRGYIYSQVDPQITPIGEDSLDIHFVIQENHKVHVRNILIAGNTKTRENVIRRELKIFPGDVFNRNKLIRSQREVWILNYFSNVVPNVQPVDDDEVDLQFKVDEKSSDRASANIGFTGEYGVTGGGGLEFTNFRGLGQTLNLSFNVGTNYSFSSSNIPADYRSFSFSFTDPMIYDTPNLVGFSIYYTYRGASTNYSFPLDFATKGASFTWGRRLRWPDDFFRASWNMGFSQTQYFGTQSDLDTYVSGLERSQGIAISQVITRDSRDRPEFTTRGSKAVWQTKISGGLLGGNEDFIKHVLDLDWYTPTFWKFVLMSSFKIGMIQPLAAKGNEISVVPYDEKFIMGGNGIPYGNMLRGYPDNSIGPVTSSGSPIGGNSMLKFTTEFRIPFSDNPVVYGLAFAEMGNVWSSASMTEPYYLPRNGPLSLKRSAGVGIRFFMPMVGMLGFDMGYGFDDITGDGKPEGWNYTITFGQPF